MKILPTVFLLFTVVSNGLSQQSIEEYAIRQVLERESATWRSGDVKGHAECWYIRPYSKILISTGDGRVLDVAPEQMVNPNPDAIGKGGTFVNSNYHFSIHDTNAWVSHEEESTAADGKRTYSYEIRLLEKIKGEWKLVGQSIHIKKI